MTIAAGDVIIDACTLVNFSVVERMDLLQERFRGHAHWTYAIQHEATRLQVEDTDWLGPPIDVGSDGVIAMIKVEQIREELGATSMDPVACHNSPRPSDLGFYPQHSCSSASLICS